MKREPLVLFTYLWYTFIIKYKNSFKALFSYYILRTIFTNKSIKSSLNSSDVFSKMKENGFTIHLFIIFISSAEKYPSSDFYSFSKLAKVSSWTIKFMNPAFPTIYYFLPLSHVISEWNLVVLKLTWQKYVWS